jgi:N-glycosylase/DNA lyase
MRQPKSRRGIVRAWVQQFVENCEVSGIFWSFRLLRLRRSSVAGEIHVADRLHARQAITDQSKLLEAIRVVRDLHNRFDQASSSIVHPFKLNMALASEP